MSRAYRAAVGGGGSIRPWLCSVSSGTSSSSSDGHMTKVTTLTNDSFLSLVACEFLDPPLPPPADYLYIKDTGCMAPIEITIALVYKEPPTSGRFLIPDSGQSSLAWPHPPTRDYGQSA